MAYGECKPCSPCSGVESCQHLHITLTRANECTEQILRDPTQVGCAARLPPRCIRNVTGPVPCALLLHSRGSGRKLPPRAVHFS
eukprot:756155-Hanusia_phi.AAC.2